MQNSNKAQDGGAQSTWIGEKGMASRDFRSDTQTTPTAAMLEAIQHCSLFDDVMQEDTTTSSLEEYVAGLTGKEAGLFVLSGTMGNQIGLRVLLKQPPHAVLCDARSHIIGYEAGGMSLLSQAFPRTIQPRNGKYLTLEDDIRPAVPAWENDDVHSCPVRVISLENTLSGVVFPLDEVARISAWARERGIQLHLDGARLWEAVAASEGRHTLRDYCQHFDTITMCFSKGLGAPVGSILVGSHADMRHARHIRKLFGGGLRQAGCVSAAARVAVDTTFVGGLLARSHTLARRIAAVWTDRLGGSLTLPVDTNMCWFDYEGLGVHPRRVMELADEEGIKVAGKRIVINYQISDEAIDKLAKVLERAVKEAREGKGKPANQVDENEGAYVRYAIKKKKAEE